MKVHILSVGRLKPGPERELCARYAERFVQTGRALSLELVQREFDESAAKRADDRKAEECRAFEQVLAAIPLAVCLDERGKAESSADFARALGEWRDMGRRDVAFIIGGADGLHANIRARAEKVVGFGALTLPHQLVRVLLLEQLYRAASILAGHPYHRV